MVRLDDTEESRRSESKAGARLQQEAIAWLSLLSSGGATQADGDALKRWCREDPAHAQAYANASRVWGLLTPIAAQAERPDSGVLPMPSVIGRRAFLGGAIAASAAGVAYATVHPPMGLWPSWAELSADVRTSTGEQRHVAVAEGVAVELNTRSSIALHGASQDSYHIELINGEAIVAARQGSNRSCVLIAGNGRVVAEAARFDVRHENDQVGVVCLEGRVEVEHRTRALTLIANEQVTYDRSGIGGVRPADSTVVTAWQQGRLIFRKEPLSQVIAEVNRYRPGRIILMDDKLGARLIDASFQLNRLENVIVYLQQAYDAPVRRLPGSVVLIG